MGDTPNSRFMMENTIKIDDLGVPLFWETSIIFAQIHMHQLDHHPVFSSIHMCEACLIRRTSQGCKKHAGNHLLTNCGNRWKERFATIMGSILLYIFVLPIPINFNFFLC